MANELALKNGTAVVAIVYKAKEVQNKEEPAEENKEEQKVEPKTEQDWSEE